MPTRRSFLGRSLAALTVAASLLAGTAFATPNLSVAARNAALAAVTAKIDVGGAGTLVFYSGTQPAGPDTALSGNTALATCTFSTTSFGAPSAGVATANAITSGTAVATGTATFARAFAGNGTTAVVDFSVGAFQAVNNVALTSNVATLTTTAAHGFAVGQTAQVSGLTNSFFNGNYTITAVTSTTFSYALNHVNVTSTADTGLAGVGDINLGTTAVTTGLTVSVTSLTLTHP